MLCLWDFTHRGTSGLHSTARHQQTHTAGVCRWVCLIYLNWSYFLLWNVNRFLLVGWDLNGPVLRPEAGQEGPRGGFSFVRVELRWSWWRQEGHLCKRQRMGVNLNEAVLRRVGWISNPQMYPRNDWALLLRVSVKFQSDPSVTSRVKRWIKTTLIPRAWQQSNKGLKQRMTFPKTDMMLI